ncbi:hypothetical protein ABZ760_01600 [Streptomyces sp. NPDC006658]|uniref:hypothetical protein n=1 Tax=Streptomyces sp. NPDC006658 TaxID=3156900 RepID=UPI003404D044
MDIVAGVGGGRPDLASSPAQKRAAANALQQHIQPDTKKAGDGAEAQTNAVVKAFGPKDGHGWLTSGAVGKAYKAWGEQVRGLLDRLSSEQASLRATNVVFGGTDGGVGAQVRGSSTLDAY